MSLSVVVLLLSMIMCVLLSSGSVVLVSVILVLCVSSSWCVNELFVGVGVDW